MVHEVVAVGGRLEADEIVGKHRAHEAMGVGERGQYLRRREGDVQEEADRTAEAGAAYLRAERY